MGVGIDAALALKPRPQLIIVLTDGETPWPATPPAASVVAALVGRIPKSDLPTADWLVVIDCV